MIKYLKNICQLILSPSKGWEDISASMTDVDVLFKKSYLPLIAVAAISEFVRLFYPNNGGFLTVFEMSIALFCTYFVSYYIARLILENYLKPFVTTEINGLRVATFVLYGLGLLAIIELIENVIRTELMLVKFLPLFIALVLFKGSKYMTVKSDKEFSFLCLAVVSVIAVPIGLLCILKLMII